MNMEASARSKSSEEDEDSIQPAPPLIVPFTKQPRVPQPIAASKQATISFCAVRSSATLLGDVVTGQALAPGAEAPVAVLELGAIVATPVPTAYARDKTRDTTIAERTPALQVTLETTPDQFVGMQTSQALSVESSLLDTTRSRKRKEPPVASAAPTASKAPRTSAQTNSKKMRPVTYSEFKDLLQKNIPTPERIEYEWERRSPFDQKGTIFCRPCSLVIRSDLMLSHKGGGASNENFHHTRKTHISNRSASLRTHTLQVSLKALIQESSLGAVVPEAVHIFRASALRACIADKIPVVKLAGRMGHLLEQEAGKSLGDVGSLSRTYMSLLCQQEENLLNEECAGKRVALIFDGKTLTASELTN